MSKLKIPQDSIDLNCTVCCEVEEEQVFPPPSLTEIIEGLKEEDTQMIYSTAQIIPLLASFEDIESQKRPVWLSVTSDSFFTRQVGDVSFSFVRATEIHFGSSRPILTGISNFIPENLKAKVKLELSHLPEEGRLFISLEVKYAYFIDEKKVANCQAFKTLSEFRIESPMTSLPRNVLLPMADIALHTTRGMLITRSSGTFFQAYPLPLLDPADLFPEG